MLILYESTAPAVVLVVEDDMLLRMRAVDMVEDAGFTPVEAVDADEAVAILESRSDIALLFTDIQMPGRIDGLKLAHAVHDRWPPIKIILVSGQVKLLDADKPIDSRFFGKPLEVKGMIAELRQMVGRGVLEIVPDAANSSAAGVLAREVPGSSAMLSAENDALRLLLEQAEIDTKQLLAQAGIDAREREAADKLQRLILEELHHRIKNTLESVRRDHAGLHSFLSMSLIEARRRNASALRLRFSQSLARRLHRPSHANVRSTTHRFGRATNPFA
jgi:CheY-like chemotaxis protein